MTLSPTALSIMIYVSLGLTVLAPVLLLVLLGRDWKSGKLW